MTDEVYRQLREMMARRGVAVNISGFYVMARTLFRPEEAEIQNAMSVGRCTPDIITRETGRSEAEVTAVLETITLVKRVGDYTPQVNRVALGEATMKKRAEVGS